MNEEQIPPSNLFNLLYKYFIYIINVTAWLDLRNNAAHGKYSEYNDNQVKQMIMGVRDFIVRNPA